MNAVLNLKISVRNSGTLTATIIGQKTSGLKCY
jgi:hypothetical protein